MIDSLVNLEFTGHPHSNKSDAEWREAFTRMNLRLLDTKYTHTAYVFKHAVYYLEVH